MRHNRAFGRDIGPRTSVVIVAGEGGTSRQRYHLLRLGLMVLWG